MQRPWSVLMTQQERKEFCKCLRNLYAIRTNLKARNIPSEETTHYLITQLENLSNELGYNFVAEVEYDTPLSDHLLSVFQRIHQDPTEAGEGVKLIEEIIKSLETYFNKWISPHQSRFPHP